MKRIYNTILIIIGIIIIGTITINMYMVNTSKKDIISISKYKKLKDVDCIIILGSGMIGDKPTPILEDRLQKGIEVYNLNITNKIIVSGDHGRVYHDEVNLMKNYLINNNIPSSNIFMDHAGFSTYETMFRAKEIFKVKKVVIITQKYHIYRSIYIAKKLGLEAYGINTDKFEGDIYRESREVLARDKDFFNLIIRPSPKYLGKPIPITSNGDLTNDKNKEEISDNDE